MADALDFMKKARAFALYGATADPGKYGYKLFSALRERYKVIPINPKRTEIEGVRCYPDLEAVGEEVDAVILALAPEVTDKVVRGLIDKSPPLIWLPPMCFFEKTAIMLAENNIDHLADVCPYGTLLQLKMTENQNG